jgi:formylglycine-generating enzyme required for sulfatase activity
MSGILSGRLLATDILGGKGSCFGGKAMTPPKELSIELGKGIKLDMVLIPAGEFMMGSPVSDKDALDDEKPQHRVRITKPFYLGKYLVTQEQWEAVIGSNPSFFKGPKNPVETVSWDDCQVFFKRLNAKVGGGRFQLPSEAQWEYSCRAGSTTRYSFGDDDSGVGEYAWYYGNSGYGPHPVGKKKPNSFGLYDMQGNVWQWCQDWYGDYTKSPRNDPTGPATGLYRVYRGGSWNYAAWYCRSAYRYATRPGGLDAYQGFRVARQPADK